ncbi:hypothetical protein DFH11DRAFT_1841923 [Phellopilus nigrolimitatus]|nr:hypothetical protein DFH11DRAFT_1841923 [Phellopilus nigrolimitatus]
MEAQTSDSDAAQSVRRKGKLRAAPEESSETTPLLGSSQPLSQDDTPSTRQHGRLLVLLSTVFLSTLCLGFVIVLVLFAITYSYSSRISNAVRDEVLDRALVIQGPERVDVLNATEGCMWLQVDLRLGIDAGTAIDVERVDFGATAIRRALGRWFVRLAGRVTAKVDGITLSSEKRFLANASVPAVTLPLIIDRPDDLSWLTILSLPVQVNVTDNATDISAFAQESWGNGFLTVDTLACHVSVHGWRHRLKIDQDDIVIPVRQKIPELPGLPSPGRNTPFPEFSDLITLESFNVTSANHSISIRASASFIDPFPSSLRTRIPSLPFSVSLSDVNATNTSSVTVAIGHTHPFSLTHPNITISLNGTVPPIPRSASPLLSSFLSSYLSGVDAPITIGSPLLHTLQIPAVFPAPYPKPQILRNVQIKNMRISLSGESVLASGTVYARVVLPKGIAVAIDAQKIWPDVLVFDGEVPDDGEDGEDLLGSGNISFYGLTRGKQDGHIKPSLTSSAKGNKERASIPKEPLPSPLPPRAFARIRPDDWLPSLSAPIPGTGGAEYEVYAQVVDVPLEVLPGRDHLLRGFIAKVVFGGRDGALAGVKGTAAVAVAVDGLPVRNGDEGPEGHVMELTGLPFTGSFRVGRKGLSATIVEHYGRLDVM